MRHRIIFYGLVLALLSSALGCTGKPNRIEQTSFGSNNEWLTSTPEEQGLDSSLILAMLQVIQKENLGIHSILIVRHDHLVTEVYYPPYQHDIKHPVYSITKSITSAVLGKALQEGHLESVHQGVLEFFPDIAQDTTDPRRKDITIEHLLTMSAGYNTGTMPNLYGKDASFDTVRHILTYNSVLHPPGTSFFYDSGSPHLLSAILQQATGMSLQTYAEQKLFQPLGITDFTWSSDPRGVTTGATGLMLRPRDMAKIGCLYLHDGAWKGEQLLPEDWVEASTTRQIETRGLMNAAEDDGYGYLWWIDSFGGFSAHGFGGQYIFVLPSLDMVIVFTGGLPDPLFPVPNQLVQSYLIPAAQAAEPLTGSTQAFQALADHIRAIEQGESARAPLPEIAQEISGKTFLISGGATLVPYNAFTLTFTEGDTYQNDTRWPGDLTFSVTGSLNHAFYLNQVAFPGPPPLDLLLPLRGYWQDNVTFIEEYMQNLNTDINLITQKYTFKGDNVTIDVSTSMGLFSGQVTGEVVE